MVVVISVHAGGMRRAAGAESRAMRPRGLRARRAAMPSTCAGRSAVPAAAATAVITAAATTTAATTTATTTTTTVAATTTAASATTIAATATTIASTAAATIWRGEGWGGREQYRNQDREVLFHGDLLRVRRTGGGPDKDRCRIRAARH